MVNSRCFILMKNRVRPDSQLFNSCGCNSWGKGMECPLPSQLGGLGECRKLPQLGLGSGAHPSQKTSFGVFRTWKNTPDFTSPDFFHFPWLFPDHFGIPWLFQVFQVSGHPDFTCDKCCVICHLVIWWVWRINLTPFFNHTTQVNGVEWNLQLANVIMLRETIKIIYVEDQSPRCNVCIWNLQPNKNAL